MAGHGVLNIGGWMWRRDGCYNMENWYVFGSVERLDGEIILYGMRDSVSFWSMYLCNEKLFTENIDSTMTSNSRIVQENCEFGVKI